MPTIVHRLFAVIDAREWERLDGFFSLDILYERPGYPPLRGLEALGRFYREERVIAAGRHHLDAVVVSATHAACWGRFTGVHRDGTSIDEAFADTYVLAPGGTRIRRRKSFFYRPAI